MKVKRSELAVGQNVEIVLQSDRKTLLEGEIELVLTKSENHPHGVLVQLRNGEKGRVVRILTDSTTTSVPTRTPANNFIRSAFQCKENGLVEYKESLLWSQDLDKDALEKSGPMVRKYGRQTSKIIIAKNLAAFLNAKGGVLLIGVKEDAESAKPIAHGVESEYKKLKDKNEDGYRRAIIDGVIEKYLPPFVLHQFSDHVVIDFQEVDGVVICGLNVLPAKQKVFINVGGESQFFVRVDASVRMLEGEHMVDYCTQRFQ